MDRVYINLIYAMKHILSFLLFAVSGISAVSAQKITNAQKQVIGYITSEGVVQDSSYNTLGYFKADGSILDANYDPLGYLKPDGSIVTVDNKIMGYYKNDVVYDGKNVKLGSVENNGKVLDAKGAEIAHLKDVGGDQASIAIFFFFKLGGVSYYNDNKAIKSATKPR